MLGSLKHLIVHDIDEEPKSFWTNVLTKQTQQSSCPRASALLKQMQSEVYSICWKLSITPSCRGIRLLMRLRFDPS